MSNELIASNINQNITKRNFFSNNGVEISNKSDIMKALEESNLNYMVEKRPIFEEDGKLIPKHVLIRKSDDGSQLGIVGKNYSILQNQQAFSFIGDIVDKGAEIIKAGTYKDFGRSFVVVKLGEEKVLYDEIAPYLLFVNSFDGSGSVRCCYTPVRVACQNTISIAFKKAIQSFSIKHIGDVNNKLIWAEQIMKNSDLYLDQLNKEAEFMANQQLTRTKFINEYIPIALEAAKITNDQNKLRNKDRYDDARQELINIYDRAEDLQNFNGTAWKALQAVADWETHREPARNKENQQIYLERAIAGMVVLNAIQRKLENEYGMIF